MITYDTDSDGNVFQIWKQDQVSSCGVASSWMARSLVRQMSFAEDEWELAQRMYRTGVQGALAALGRPTSGPMTYDPRAFDTSQASVGSTFANFGLYGSQVAAALRAEGLNVNHQNSSSLVPHLLGDTRVAIVLVAWSGGGGHFIVAARVTRGGKIVFLDPWDGRIKEQANNGRYNSHYNNSGSVVETLYLAP